MLVALASMPMALRADVTSRYVFVTAASPTCLVVVLLKERNTLDSFENYDVGRTKVNYPTARHVVDAIAVVVNVLLPHKVAHAPM